MITLLVFTAVLGLALSGAQAQTHWVAKSGNDDNACKSTESPCLTVQGAVGKVENGSVAAISIGPGTYEEQINIFRYRVISLFGNCEDISAVTLRGSQPGPIIWVEDHPIVIVDCLTLEAAPGISGVAGIASRQFSVVDYSRTRFGNMPGGTHILASEMSRSIVRPEAPGRMSWPVPCRRSSSVVP
jgi:hypothetical protein